MCPLSVEATRPWHLSLYILSLKFKLKAESYDEAKKIIFDRQNYKFIIIIILFMHR
jgi:hypothetical protein